MSVLPDELRARIIARHHTVTRIELVEAGLRTTDIARWRSCGVIVELTPGVFAVADAVRAEPFLTRAAALSTARPDAVCDPLTSARIWKLPGVFTPSQPTLCSASGLPPSHIVDRGDGIRVLTPAATWLGMTTVLRPDHFERFSDAVMADRVPVRAAHEAIRLAADHRRRPHVRAMRVLSIRRSWQRPHWSEHERRVRAALRRRGITGLDGSHTIELPSGIVLHPTAVDHDRRWAIEVDHRSWHRGRWSNQTQRWIDGQLDALGWSYVRITDRQLDRDPNRTMSMVATSHPTARQAAA